MKVMNSLDGQTVAITGAGQGIGRAIATKTLELGGNVVAIDLDAAGLDALQAQAPERVMVVNGSVTDESLATQTVDSAVARFGALHGLVNNAGIIRPALIEKMTARQWQEVIDVHMTGSFYWLQAVGRHMIARAKAGDTGIKAIVNISSDAARKGGFGLINYAAAKAGMLAMTMTAAREWGKHGIRTNSVCFGAVETEMTETIRSERLLPGLLAQIPLGYCAPPEEVARAVCFLLSNGSAYITGQHIGVNGGFHVSL